MTLGCAFATESEPFMQKGMHCLQQTQNAEIFRCHFCPSYLLLVFLPGQMRVLHSQDSGSRQGLSTQ